MKEKMNFDKKTWILTSIVCLIPVLAGIILYPQLPDQIATHWDAAGNVNGISHRFTGAILFPGILAVITVLMPFLMQTDPKYENMNGKLKAVIQWIIPLVCMVCSGVTLSSALGIDLPVELIMPMVIGMLMVVVGNYLPKTKQSYTLGIKLPWTLNSEDNWNRTHRLGGFVFVIGGIVIIISGFFPCRAVILTICTVLMVGIPTVYSFLLYQKSMKK